MLLKFLHVTSCLYSQHVTLLAFFISSYHLLHFFTSPSSFLHITFFMSLLVHYRDQKKKKTVTPKVFLLKFLHVTSCLYSQHVTLCTLFNSA